MPRPDATDLPEAAGARLAFESGAAWKQRIAAAADRSLEGIGPKLLIVFTVSSVVGGSAGYAMRNSPGGLVVEVVSGREITGSTKADLRGDSATDLARLRQEVGRLEAQLALLHESGEDERSAQPAGAKAERRAQEAALAQRLKEISARLERLERAAKASETGDKAHGVVAARRR